MRIEWGGWHFVIMLLGRVIVFACVCVHYYDVHAVLSGQGMLDEISPPPTPLQWGALAVSSLAKHELTNADAAAARCIEEVIVRPAARRGRAAEKMSRRFWFSLFAWGAGSISGVVVYPIPLSSCTTLSFVLQFTTFPLSAVLAVLRAPITPSFPILSFFSNCSLHPASPVLFPPLLFSSFPHLTDFSPQFTVPAGLNQEGLKHDVFMSSVFWQHPNRAPGVSMSASCAEDSATVRALCYQRWRHLRASFCALSNTKTKMFS